MNKIQNLAAIILAAGKGKRMKLKGKNKVTLLLGDKPMILHTVTLLRSLFIDPIIVVVGFAKHSVIHALGDTVVFAEQKKRLGTAHAALQGVKMLPKNSKDVLILQGDDSAFYTQEIVKNLIAAHLKSQAVLTMLTIETKDPTGLGRIVRDKSDNIVAIVEEKDASEKIRMIKEVNPACYLFKKAFLVKYLPKIQKSSITKEYYLTSLIDIAIENNEKIEVVKGGKIPWRGINTQEELRKAKEIYSQFVQT